MRAAVAAVSLFLFAVVAIVFIGDESRNMFAPVPATTMNSGRTSAAPIYRPALAPVEYAQYFSEPLDANVQPAYVQTAYAEPTAYGQPVEYAPAEEDGSWTTWACAAAFAFLVGTTVATRRPGVVAEPDLEAAAGATRVAALALSGRGDNPMNFDGWAPEVINGRLAQVGFLAAIQQEVATGQTLAEQFQNNFSAFGYSVLLVTLASFAPSLQQFISKDSPEGKHWGYASDPKTIAPSEDPFGVFKASSEMANSRAAMVGIAAMLATELMINRPIFMLGVDGKDAAELEDAHAKLRVWADRAGAKLLADKRTVALLGLGGTNLDAQDDEPAIDTQLTAAMGFSGWAPEVINGRLAQLGFLAALGTEALNPGEKLADQFVDNFPLFAGSVLAVVVASFAPEVQRQNVGSKKVEYTADPKSIDPKEDPFGVFSYSSEMSNSRAAMIGIAAMLITEQMLQRPLIMLGVDGEEAATDAEPDAAPDAAMAPVPDEPGAELRKALLAAPAQAERSTRELRGRLGAWAAEAGADLVADAEKVAMLFMSGSSSITATPKMRAPAPVMASKRARRKARASPSKTPPKLESEPADASPTSTAEPVALGVGRVTPTSTAKPAGPAATSTGRPAVWNPQNLDVPKLPDIPGAKLFEQQFVPEYLKSSPPYLTGALAGDIGFDPWCLVALAKPTKENAMEFDKNLRTAEARKQKMLSMSEEEQAETVAWMRNAEIKHARLAMLAAAGWPLAELANGQSMRFATNGRAPSLFNGHLLDFWPALLIVFGGLSYLELTTKDKIKDGDFGFDPLGIASGKGPVGGSGQPIFDSLPDSIPNIGDMEALKLAELKNGRAAMMAITGFAVQEFFWGKPVTELTPIFF